MTYIDEYGKPEPKSQPGAWSKINEIGAFSKKKVRLNRGVTSVIRELGGFKKMSEKTILRKQKTAEKIARIQRANLMYRTMIEHPLSKRDKTGAVILQTRGPKGHFLPKQVLLN